jgi:hypothetical protein
MVQNEEISEKVAEFLKGGKCELSKYYHLLKTHKIPPSIGNPSQWLEDNGFPIRGIVSGRGAPTERLSGFVDHHLQAGMQNFATFLKDSKHTLQIIEQINDKIGAGEVSLEGVGLVSLDVDSMYNNMSEELGTGACKEFLESRSQQDGDDPFVSTNSLLTALGLCLKNNYFSFNEKIFKQISGVGTGIKLAPTYACLGLGKYEKQVFSSNQALLDKILLWKRFIDDGFMFFKGIQKECLEFVEWLNSRMPGVGKIKF